MAATGVGPTPLLHPLNMHGALEVIGILGKPALLAGELAGPYAVRCAVTKFLPLDVAVIGEEKTAAVWAPPFF